MIEYYTIYITNNHLFLRESQNNIVSIVYSTYCCINVFKYSSTLSNLSELNFCSLILQLIHIQKGWWVVLSVPQRFFFSKLSKVLEMNDWFWNWMIVDPVWPCSSAPPPGTGGNVSRTPARRGRGWRGRARSTSTSSPTRATTGSGVRVSRSKWN